jgi:hypothetical protein
MHETLVCSVKGYIDIFNNNFIKGWVFHNIYGILPIRIKINNEYVDEIINIDSRNDVAEFYKNNKIINCGFNIYNETIHKYFFEIEMFIENSWIVIFSFNKKLINSIVSTINKKIPNFIVVDNIYEDPDKVRNFALLQKFNEHPNYHKGKRTDEVFLFDGLKEIFEYHLNKRIKDWTKYGVNGCFQYCIAGDNLVYHTDFQEYAAIIYLTPDAPPQTGTSFYRSKYTKEIINNNTDIVFKNGFLDSTQFELVDQIGNVYNRLIIFNSKIIHAASCYFGNNYNNGRLFQMFFFDLEE